MATNERVLALRGVIAQTKGVRLDRILRCTQKADLSILEKLIKYLAKFKIRLTYYKTCEFLLYLLNIANTKLPT